MKSTTNGPRKKVLIVHHHDNWLEVFADDDVDVHIEEMPFGFSQRSRDLAERLMESSLKHPYRQLYWPSNRRAAQMLRKTVLISELFAKLEDSMMWNSLKDGLTAAMSTSNKEVA